VWLLAAWGLHLEDWFRLRRIFGAIANHGDCGSGSPKRAAPRPFRGGAQPEAYWASRRYQDNVGAFRQRQQR